MPELPEVESFRKGIDPIALNKEISKITIHDDYILKMPTKKFKDALIGKKFTQTERRGKYLFIHFDSKNLMLHFAMSGTLKYYNNPKNEPEYSKIQIEFKNGDYLSIVSVRKLGKVEIIENISKYAKQNKIGPDALGIKFEDFITIMENKKRSYAKTALMDQSAISGIGNEYSDEILYQANIYPKTKISNLNTPTIKTLYKAMVEVLNTAIDLNIKNTKFPDDYLMPHRDKNDKCPKCGSGIKRYEISSRHGFYCPKCQSE
jgi:formamidopyrimidine-DNA glycosylase